MKPIAITPKLHLIPLDQKLTGYFSFIGSWLYQGEKTFLVDVGPAATVPDLLIALETLGVQKLDAILLTHIHLDHAGGIGHLSAHYPDAPIICHKSGLKHLSDPTRLWEGSLKTLGDTARAYGPIQPVPEFRLNDAEEFIASGLETFMTPGHAAHHVSYLYNSCLFAGEAGGVFIAISDNRFYLRPATPPRFFLETNMQSVDVLLKVPHEIMCYGHFGATRDSQKLLEAHRQQLFRWADVIRKHVKRDSESDLVERCVEALLKEDPLMEAWDRLDPAVQQRELFFLKNSVRGFLGYLETS